MGDGRAGHRQAQGRPTFVKLKLEQRVGQTTVISWGLGRFWALSGYNRSLLVAAEVDAKVATVEVAHVGEMRSSWPDALTESSSFLQNSSSLL